MNVDTDDLIDQVNLRLTDLTGTRERAIVKVLLHIVKELLPCCLEKNLTAEQVEKFFQQVFENEVVRAWTVIQVIVLTEFEERV